MLMPYDLVVEVEGEPRPMRAVRPTLFAGADDIGGWMTLAVRAHQAQAFVALVLLDESEASARLRGELERRYHDLDRITGDALTVLTDARPPDDWFRATARALRDEPAVKTRLRLDAQRLQGEAGRQQAAANTRALLAEGFEGGGAVEPPAIVLLDLRELDGEEYAVGGVAFSLASFTGPGQLVAALRTLTEIAEGARRRGEGVDAVAARGWSWTRWSLRWSGALNDTVELLRRLRQMWVPRPG